MVILGAFFVFSLSLPMVDLKEELLSKSEESGPVIVSESAALTDGQKQAIQTALTKMFSEQMASTNLYGEIVAALVAAMNTPEVAASNTRFIVGLNELVKVYFKNLKLSGEQLAKLRDLLETLKTLAMIQMKHLDPQTIDQALEKQIASLQERLAAHIAPMNAGLSVALSQDQVNTYQKNVLELLVNLIKDVLAILPAGSQAAGAGNPPRLAEPMVPERIEVVEEVIED